MSQSTRKQWQLFVWGPPDFSVAPSVEHALGNVEKTVLKDEISGHFPGSSGGWGGLHYGKKQGCARGCCPVLLGLSEENSRSVS